jgi:toxin ParE1/3/4
VAEASPVTGLLHTNKAVRLLVHPRVKADLVEAVYYYDRKLPGLGKAVIGQMTRLLDRLCRHPLAYPRTRFEVRRASVAGLNVELLYLHDKDRLILLAVSQIGQESINAP